MTTVVRFENVSKRYNLGLTRSSLPALLSDRLPVPLKRKADSTSDGILWALKDVSFSLTSSQSLALVGPNGAGKTTILKLLANITKPTSGQLQVSGKLSALIELGAGFHPDLTGRENIFLNGTILGLSRQEIKRRFDEIVDFSELERFIDTPVKRYSSGMIVRLGFAVASCIEPEILLVDEVLAVGDASFQQKCLERIHSLINKGTTMLFVSHNFYLVQAACNIALYLRNGQVIHYGAVRDVIDMYEQDLHRERAQKLEGSHSEEPGENAVVEITRVEVGNGDGAAASVLRSDQPAQFRIHYNAYKSLGRVQVSVFIFRADGVKACMMRTKLDGFNLVIERGQGVVTVQLTLLQLVGGTYYAEAWFLNESDSLTMTSRAGRSDWFTVQGKALGHSETSVFEPLTHWEHQQNSEIDVEGSSLLGNGKRALN